MANPFSHPKQDSGSSFLPEDYISRKADVRSNMICLALFVIVMLGVASAFLVTNRQWASVKEEHKAISAAYEQEAKKIDQLKDLEKQRRSMLERAEITVALVEKSPRSVLMASLVTSMPEGVTLLDAGLSSKRVTTPVVQAPAEVKSLTSSKKSSKKSSKSKSSKDEKAEPPKPQAPRFETSLRLTGVATTNEQIADYVTKLKACEMLEAVELTYIKESVMSELALRKFQVDARIRANAKLPAEAIPSEPVPAAGATASAATTETNAQSEPTPGAAVATTDLGPAPEGASPAEQPASTGTRSWLASVVKGAASSDAKNQPKATEANAAGSKED